MIKYFVLIMLLGIVLVEPVFDEGLQVLTHYVFGDGEDMELNSSYIPKSPVIIKALKEMKVGETKVIGFNQKEDWRLSYAINGFKLTKKSDGFEIHQYIKFDTTGNVYTDVHTPLGDIRIYDDWVHFKQCHPFNLSFRYVNLNRKSFIS